MAGIAAFGAALEQIDQMQPVEEGKRARVLRVVKEAFVPEPMPAPRP